ncbi:hypothetical protein D5R38_18660 [Serratia marcescens]|uniref:hypothetical protein n=1 Tax=Serratia marcescens TaxID=615 RepID=UPI00106740A6|nr:hypothetical protein [Serratia marcescens]TEW83393.1 hypothetical protein D5R38_18660 [Serratia marcescens]
MKLTYITMTQAGQRYGYSLNGIKSWIKEGLPFDSEKKMIPEKAGTEWILENKINPMKAISVKEEMDKEKLREQRAKADLAQMASAKEAGYLIETDYVQAALDSYLGNFRDIIRGIPRNYSQEILVAAADGQKGVKTKLTEIITDALNEIGDLMLDKDMEELIEEPELELLQRPVTEIVEETDEQEEIE